MIDYFAAEDIADDGETLTQWLARRLGEQPEDAAQRLAEMAEARAGLRGETGPVELDGRAAA